MLIHMTASPTPRIALVDAARTVALLGMAVFHFVFDLEMFGHLPQGTVAMPGPWAYFARLVAGSFIFLAGVSLVLAHGQGLRWRSFLRRLAILAAAAAAITVGTYVMMPDQFVFFGILHAIATFSVIGLAFLRLPPLVTLIVAAGVFALPWVWSDPFFQSPALIWIGLAPTPPRAMDFEPLFPWLAPFLAGMAITKLAQSSSLWPALNRRSGQVLHCLTWPGRHSLLVYLVHQPVLIGLVWGFTRLTG
jgi:uncharacterized membrane protein